MLETLILYNLTIDYEKIWIEHPLISDVRIQPTHQFPGVEVHAGQFAVVWLGNVKIEGLTLVNVGSTVCRHLQDNLLCAVKWNHQKIGTCGISVDVFNK